MPDELVYHNVPYDTPIRPPQSSLRAASQRPIFELSAEPKGSRRRLTGAGVAEFIMSLVVCGLPRDDEC